MRDIALIIFFFSILPFVFKRPYIGVYIWVWLGLMNPHRLTWGFAYYFPFAEITAITVLISMLASKEPKQVPWTRETILLLFFILWMLITTFFAFYPDLAWVQWDKVWKIMLMTYVTMMLINSRQKLDWLVWVVVLSLGFYGVKGGIFTIVTGGAYHVQGPPGSFIYGNNEMGLALILTVPLMRYLQLQAKSVWIHQSVVGMMLLTSIAIVGSQSRGALVGIVAMGSFLWLKSRNKIFTLVSLLVIVGLVAAIMPQQWYDRMATIETYQQDSSAMGRIYSWLTAFNLAKHRITGGGFETFREQVFDLYGPRDFTRTADAHSIYFEVMGEHGFIGFFMFMLLGLFIWNTGSRIRKQGKRSMETKWAADLASMVQVSIIGYASSGAFLGLAYFDLYYTLVAIMVICSVLLKEQILHMQAAKVPPKPGVSLASEQPVNEFRSQNG
jgi:probable O-glycosylation ligase (exosortase A-associated)